MATITKDKLQEILKGKPSGATDEMIVKGLIGRGHTIDGLELPSQRRKQEDLAKQEQAMVNAAGGGDVVRGIAEDIGEAGQEIKGAFAGDAARQEEIQQLRESGEQGGLSSFIQSLGSTGRAVGETVGAGAKGIIKSFLPKPAQEVIGEGVSAVGEEIVKRSLEGEQLPNAIAEFKKLSPETQRNIIAGAGILEGVTSVTGIGPTVSLLKEGAKLTDDVFRQTLRNLKPDSPPTVENVTPDTVRITAQAGDVSEYQKGVDGLAKAYQNSLIGDKAAKGKLDELARDANVTVDELMKEFVDARGLAGEIDDVGRVSFDKALRDFGERQTNLAKAIDTALANRPELTPVSQVRNMVTRSISDRGTILNRGAVDREVTRLIDDLERQYPNGIPAQDLNRIRIQANQKFKDQFEVDANRAIGDAMRSRIDELDPSLTEANAQWGKLEDMKKIASVMDGRKVDAGVLADSLGSYVGAAMIGASGLATGSGSLVIASLAATFGRRTLANAIRRRIINNPQNQALIDAVRQDETLVKEILKGVEDANKAQMERLLLPEGTPSVSSRTFGEMTPERRNELISEIEAQTTRTEVQKVLQSQAGRFKKRETFIKSVKDNPAWLKKFEEAGTSPESVADIVFNP